MSIEEIKEALKQAEQEVNNLASPAHEAARKVVNIERQAFYGGQSPTRRLSLIREVVSDLSKELGENEV